MRTSITIPKELNEKAHALGVNISRVSTNAVAAMVKKIEYDAARDSPSKDNPVTATVEARRGGIQHERICSK